MWHSRYKLYNVQETNVGKAKYIIIMDNKNRTPLNKWLVHVHMKYDNDINKMRHDPSPKGLSFTSSAVERDNSMQQ